MSDKKIRFMVTAAVMAALTYVATTVVRIPAPTGGYVHMGDGLVLLCGWILGPWWGGAAAGIVLKETIVWSLRRSAFSNEAGLGSAAIAHSAADTPGPVQQGMYGIFECFADTIVICSLTALTIICSGVEIPFGVKPGSELITAAFATVFGDKIASTFVAVALTLFAFTTILGWSLYGSRCFQYLFGLKADSV